MEAAWHRRMLWRRRGAWMWPAFIAAVVADAVIGHELPPAGGSEAIVAAGLLGLVANIIAIVLLTRPLAMLLRKRRPDLPMVVARDYAGTTLIASVTALVALAGLAHQHTITTQQHAMKDAISRAQAFIGDRAPAEFRRNVQWVSTFAIQPGTLYRACVPSAVRQRTYCVIVNERRPFPTSVRFDGYEPNSTFSLGVN